MALWPSAFVASAQGTAPRPNILFILGDDVGLDDVSCYGSDDHRTPNIDRLAESGLRFETCYAAPVCGPSRCLLMTGRYAFRTGGLDNQSWRHGGPGARSANEHPVAEVLKRAGYATGMAGKWRQVGETPRAWGFEDYMTDPACIGWYWRTQYQRNGKQVSFPQGTYSGEVYKKFAFNFFRHHANQPFFFYYAPHNIHAPIQRTPATVKRGTGNLYEDNIRYLDDQVGAMVAELENLGIRDRTLVIFSGDNGTAQERSSPIAGRLLDGYKGTMREGGARVPFIANWPGVTPAGQVSQDMISFADPLVTFAELAGAALPDGFAYDGWSFAPQLLGEPGTPRPWAYVQFGTFWYAREAGFKMNDKGELFDMTDAPFSESLVDPAADTADSLEARARLAAVLQQLNPAGGITDPRGPAFFDPSAED